MSRNPWLEVKDRLVTIPVDSVSLEGNLGIPAGAEGIILFAHGSGSSRHSPRNRFVAQTLRQGGLATLLMDLLTADEEAIDMRTQRLRFDIALLARRLVGIVDWLATNEDSKALNIGLFGSSTGAAAALIAAKERPELIHAVVSRGGRPDLAAAWLPEVKAPTLLIVGGQDFPVIGVNEHALSKLRSEKEFEIVPGATHLFVEPGALEKVAISARDWFLQHLTSASAARRAS
jgi:putative phosphoribosyl transferase